jgi:hypothetical protein
MADIIDKYKGTRYYNIKNHEEMRNYIRETIPELIYSEKMLEDLVKIELNNLIEYKINLKKDILYTA